jgi:hypothetical protein
MQGGGYFNHKYPPPSGPGTLPANRQHSAREAADVETLRRHMAESDLPNLWKPGRDCYVEVESLPILGT